MCIDALGSNTPDDLIPIVEKYHKKLNEFTDEFVDDCIKENIEYCSAFGFLFSHLDHLLAMKYAKRNYEIKKGNV
ncbi:hypothetical protein SAMN05443270_3093 [Lacrimispora sphenoides]|nr:hypothetical protein SAMN05443270_3093 [Lacrimispora sphenoides]